ncbi:putative S-acyltransferase [Apostasia shenzhenica]|uniref:S-acyltransferase n=1 Tax=Apostasia shenzhenica TaxID=1088818 RepID=A0A2I0B297_9ASPA|nr:putative S-acyltransferase [Apostasia shenzhenica]
MGSPVILASVASCIVVLVTHFALAMVPRLLPSISFLAMLPIAAVVLVATHTVAGCGRGLLRVKASAPAMVFGHILFLWGVHIAVIRYEEISTLLDASLNIECILLLIGLYKIVSCDPGVVAVDSTCSEVLDEVDSSQLGPHYKGSPCFSRIRHCSSCKRNVMGYDHHCPAFGNCIGQKNHYLFMTLVFGFIITEATYTMCSTQYMTLLLGTQRLSLETNQFKDLVISTMLFSLLQVVWQVLFLTWHMYCICCNIKTEEWINWTKYSEFQILAQPLPGSLIKMSLN